MSVKGLDYWERLEKLYSQEWSWERYYIIVIWKLSQGLVQLKAVSLIKDAAFNSSRMRGGDYL